MSQGEQRLGISDFERAASQLDQVPPGILELLDRQATAFLYAIWKARGRDYRIVEEREYQHLRATAHKYNLQDGNE